MNPKMIITLKLTNEQNKIIEKSFQTNNYNFICTDVYTDAIALPCTSVIINAEALGNDEYETLILFYDEVGTALYETVFWIGKPLPPKRLIGTIKCYESFEDYAINIRYHILDAQRRYKKNSDFSDKLADCLYILSEIRKHPYIKINDLAEKLEKSPRTINRYIQTLVATGEWISYDNQKKGWYLEYGKSLLFGDVFNNTDNQ